MEIKNPDELSKLIELLRKKGVKSFKSGDLAIELAPEALFPLTDYQKKKLDKDAVIANPIAEADKLLYWSSEVNQ